MPKGVIKKLRREWTYKKTEEQVWDQQNMILQKIEIIAMTRRLTRKQYRATQKAVVIFLALESVMDKKQR